MKDIKYIRFIIQIISILLTIVGLFTSFQLLMAVIVATMLIGGTFYCGWVCPFGTIQEYINKLGRILRFKQMKMPTYIHKYLQYSRYILGLLLTLISLDFVFSILSVNPEKTFSALLIGEISSLTVLFIIISFLLISLKFDRFFCNYLCMEGAKFGVIGSLRIFTIHKSSSCINCKKCDHVCPMQISVSTSESLRNPQCINCFKCVNACPIDNTLTYKKINFNRKHIIFYSSVIGLLLIGLVSFGFVQKNIPNIIPESVNNQDIINQIDINGNYIDGIYTGNGRGFRGNIEVEVKIVNSFITEINILQHNEDRKWYNRAVSVIPSEIIKKQSADIDTVTGATYSSIGIIDAVKDALNQAQ